MKILLVEDDSSLREGMAEALADLADVRATGDVHEAVTHIQEEGFQLVLADLHIGPSQQGGRAVVEACRTVLTPVAVVSASAPEEVTRALRPLAADALLTKPFSLDDFLMLAESYLHLSQALERRPPPPSASGEWRERSHGIHVMEQGAQAWVRVSPGAAGPWPLAGRRAFEILEGALELDGARHQGPRYRFLGSAAAPLLRSIEGCVVTTRARSP